MEARLILICEGVLQEGCSAGTLISFYDRDASIFFWGGCPFWAGGPGFELA
jgi:hypothetical protein